MGRSVSTAVSAGTISWGRVNGQHCETAGTEKSDMRNILVICDDIWHPVEVIKKGLLPLLKGAYQVDLVKAAKDILTVDTISQYSLIICCKGNNVTSGNPAPWFIHGE